MNKQLIRTNISAQKKNYSTQIFSELSHNICDILTQTDVFQKAHCIALYFGMKDEVQTSVLIEEWSGKKIIALPVVHGNDINFHEFTGKENLNKGVFDIQEPTSVDIIPEEDIDVFIVPGVAFDRNGNRLGRGKGYYDRYLAGINKPIIGVCFDFQLIDSITTENHDVKMSMIITEKEILKMKPLPHALRSIE